MTIYDDDEFDSPEEAIAHYKELLKALRARKRVLDIQAAKYGIAVPAHVVTELEEVREQIRQLVLRVKGLETSVSPSHLAVSPIAPKTILPSTAKKVNPIPSMHPTEERNDLLDDLVLAATPIATDEQRTALPWEVKSEEEKQLIVLQEVIRCINNNTRRLPHVLDIMDNLGISMGETERLADMLEKARYINRTPGYGGLIPTTKGREWLKSKEP